MHRNIIMCDSVRWPVLIRIPLSAFLWVSFSVWFLCHFFLGSLINCIILLPAFFISFPSPPVQVRSSSREGGEGPMWQQLFPRCQPCSIALYREAKDFPRTGSHCWRRKGSIWRGSVWAKKDQAITQPQPLVPNVRAGLRAPVGVVVKLEVKFVFSLSSWVLEITQGHWSKPEKMWELLVLPLFHFIIISQGAVTPLWNWNRSFYSYL